MWLAQTLCPIDPVPVGERQHPPKEIASALCRPHIPHTATVR